MDTICDLFSAGVRYDVYNSMIDYIQGLELWFHDKEESSFDETAPIWDLSFQELQEAYKTSAMKRQLAWYTEKTLEKTYCLPYFKINKKVGNFPRRITWLYPEEGNCTPIFDLSLPIHIKL